MLFQKVQWKLCGEFSSLAIALHQTAWSNIQSEKTAGPFCIRQIVRSLGFKTSLLLGLSGEKSSQYQVPVPELMWEENVQVNQLHPIPSFIIHQSSAGYIQWWSLLCKWAVGSESFSNVERLNVSYSHKKLKRKMSVGCWNHWYETIKKWKAGINV